MLFEDRDGQLWSYEDEIIPCNDAQKHGHNCESPVERHWVESEVPDWVQDSDERENSPEHEGEDEFKEESETEEDPFVDKLELEVENYQMDELDNQDEPTDESDVQEDELTDESDDQDDDPTDDLDDY